MDKLLRALMAALKATIGLLTLLVLGCTGATATPESPGTPTPTPEPIELSGTGPATMEVTFPDGTYGVTLWVENNFSTINPGGGTNFVVRFDRNYLANVVETHWTGSLAIEVGSGSLIPDNRFSIRVEAALEAEWHILAQRR